MTMRHKAAISRGASARRSGRHAARLVTMIVHAAILFLTPTKAVAHDAFGDLGPFYGNLLHPLADPLQAAVLVGTAAFLAGRSISAVRKAIPIFIVVASCASVAAFSGLINTPPTIFAGMAALLIGLAATLPQKLVPQPVVYVLVGVTGAITGLAPGAPISGLTLQPLLGSVFGIAGLLALWWFTLDIAARQLTHLVPKVVGSWVAAMGILIVAFSA